MDIAATGERIARRQAYWQDFLLLLGISAHARPLAAWDGLLRRGAKVTNYGAFITPKWTLPQRRASSWNRRRSDDQLSIELWSYNAAEHSHSSTAAHC